MIVMLASLAGCVSHECDWAEPIRPHPDDSLTDGTADAILGHNEIGAAVCGWRAAP